MDWFDQPQNITRATFQLLKFDNFQTFRKNVKKNFKKVRSFGLLKKMVKFMHLQNLRSDNIGQQRVWNPNFAFRTLESEPFEPEKLRHFRDLAGKQKPHSNRRAPGVDQA